MEKNPKYWEFKNVVDRSATLKIYGDISKYAWWDNSVVTASNFTTELDNLEDIDTLNLCIDSLGGVVTEATTIYNALKRFKKEKNVKIVTFIDGIAASAASFIAMAGDEICMGLGASFMIHNIQGGKYGESRDLRQTADLMDKLKENIIDIYKTQTNLSREEISDLMDKTSWMTSQEALDYGFIDKIENYEDVEEEKLSNLFTEELVNHVVLPKRVEEYRNKNFENKPAGKGKGEDEMPFTQEEVNNMVNSAVEAERKRIKELEAIPTNTVGAKEMVNKAKFDAPLTPQEVTYNIMTSNEFKAQQEVQVIMNEQEENGVNKIGNPPPSSESGKEDEEIKNNAKMIADMMNGVGGM